MSPFTPLPKGSYLCEIVKVDIDASFWPRLRIQMRVAAPSGFVGKRIESVVSSPTEPPRNTIDTVEKNLRLGTFSPDDLRKQATRYQELVAAVPDAFDADGCLLDRGTSALIGAVVVAKIVNPGSVSEQLLHQNRWKASVPRTVSGYRSPNFVAPKATTKRFTREEERLLDMVDGERFQRLERAK